jgi:phage-related minor tail protein
MVGEKGPELFSPNSNGSIVPNHQLRGGSGGGGVKVGSINITVQGGQTNEETGDAVSKSIVDTMKGIARMEIASSRRVGGILNPV